MTTKGALLKTAENNLESLGNALGKKLGTTINSNGEVDDGKLNGSKLEDSFTKSGSSKAIPEKVYKKIAEAVYNKIDQSIFDNYSTKQGECIKQVAAEIGSLLSEFDNIKVPVKENGKTVTYTVEFPYSLFAISGGEIKVSNGSQNWKLQFKNNKTAKNAMAQYCVALHNLGKEALNDVLSECVNVFTSGASDLLKAIYSDAPVDAQIQKIIDMTKEKTKEAVKEEIKAALPKSLNKALTKYETLTATYKNLETLLNSDSSKLSAISAVTKKFSDASNALNKSLKSFNAAVSLDTFPNLSEEVLYNDNYTAVTVPSGVFGDYYNTTKKVDNSEWSVPVRINGHYLDNILIGGSAKNTIYGYEGNDSLVGGKSDDELYGGSGADTLSGGKGKDKLYGNAGNDILDGGSGNDKLYGGEGYDTLRGGDGNDYLDVSSGKNYLDGGKGKDTLYGGYGNDTLFGGAGNDSLNGYSGDDYLNGGAGKDTLLGGYGSDILWGGADNDTLYGEDGNDIFIYKPGEGTDTIFDYQSGDMLIILKKDGKEGGAFTKATFKNNILTLKISGGGSVIFNGVSAGDQININGTTRTIKGSTLK